MFRELTRKNKQLPREECIALLQKETRGVLSVIGDEGYPYGSPMNHFYDERDGAVYFHCGKSGHRLDAIRRDSKASFCVYDKGVSNDGEWALNVKSVILFGRIEIIDDRKIIVDIAEKLSRKFTDDQAYIHEEIQRYANATLLLKLTPEHICGKAVKES